ncbi:MAG: insulinase family protein [Myxococcales bacterium]|nr:insulinase family protein [Myxococcales bacterium]MCB9731286.1 insulinase family protein [Deltaproteobacteria bacterium]
MSAVVAPEDIVLIEDHSRPIETFVLSLPVGCLHDPPGKEGLAYLTGQMLLRGAGSRDHAAFVDEIDFLGSSLSVGTSRERTSVSGDALTRNLDAIEGLVADLLGAPHFDPAELDKLRRQTIAELAQVQDNDSALGHRFFARALFGEHPYGRPLKGTEESLARIGIDDVRAFFAERFVTQGAIVGVAGDIGRERLDAFLAATLGRLPQRAAEVPTVPACAVQEGYRLVLVDKPERSQTQVFIGHVTLDANHEDFFPLLVAQTIFGGTFTARISHEIREKRGWSYGAYSYLSADRHLGTFTIRFYPATGDTVPAIVLADQMFSELVRDGISESEVDFAKSYLSNSHCFAIDTPERLLSERLSAKLNGRPDDFVESFVARVNAVTREAANAAVRRHLRPDAQVAAVVATAAELKPALEAWERVTSLETVDYKSQP